MPLHELLPLDKQRMPMIKGPFTFIVTSRGCPAGCKFCIKHVSYQTSVRVRSPQNILEELQRLAELGIHNVHMYADLFTVNREQVVELCQLIIDAGLKVSWTCNSRVDYVDEEMLQLMGQAGCWFISWGIESANEQILKRAHKGYQQGAGAPGAAAGRKAAGIKNWGYFIIGLPGETEETIQETIAYAKELPLDIALFHIAAPYPGTPFFFEVVENGWFRPGTRWEEVDMDQSTVLDYPDLPAERLEYWQKRATREWSLRPGPMLTFLKGMNSLGRLQERGERGVADGAVYARMRGWGLGVRGWGWGIGEVEIKSYRDLRVWQAGMDLVVRVYRLTQGFPTHELYGLTSQMRRAAVSIPSNIAEGHTRESSKEYLHHLSIAQGSLAELETQIEIAGRLTYITPDQVAQSLTEVASLGRQMHALRDSLQRKGQVAAA